MILLTHSLPMRSILFWIVRCCRSLFKCNYLKSEKSFLSFLFLLWNLHQILNIFKKKEGCHSQCITKFNDCQKLGYSIFEKPSSQKFFWKSTCERVSNNCEIWFRALLSYYLITLRINDLEHISLIEISNIRGVC